jgi:MFS family permease
VLVGSAAEDHVIAILRAQLRTTLGVLTGFRGNARALLVTEPLWGIPYNLYATYASVYMLALGCTETQVGLVATVSLLFQIVFSLLGGWVTDRLGRKRATLIFDLISWSIPTLLLAFARSLTVFLIAAIINAIVRVVYTSWDCLMVEDTAPEQRVHFYTWIAIAGIMAGFISPVSGLLVDRFGLVPGERILYLFAFVSMTFMFIWRNTLLRETKIGLLKMREARHGNASATLREYGRIIRELLASPLTVAAFLLSLLLNIQFTLRGTFLSILLVRGLGFSEGIIAVFPAINAAVTLAIYALGMPAIGRMQVHRPFLAGLVLSAVGALLLVVSPMQSMTFVVLSTVIGALGAAVTGPLSSALIANSVPAHDRAKVMSLFYALVQAACSPFGYIGGLLAARSERLPFVLVAAAFVPAIALAALLPAIQRRQARLEAGAP